MHIQLASQGDSRWWKYLLAIISILFALSIGHMPIALYSFYKKNKLNISDEKFDQYVNTMNYAELGISENLFLLLVLTTFVFAFIALIWLFPIIHKRPALSFITSRKKFDIKRFLRGLFIWLFFACIVTFLFLDSDKYIFNFQFDQFLPLALIAILLVPIQSATEEIFFRGYLMQGIYNLTNKKWITLTIITLIFAFSHVLNPEFKEGILLIIPSYLIFSFVLGYITLIDNGLEIPIGIHTGNNIFVALILSAKGASVTTPSLFQTSIENLVDILPISLTLLSVLTFVSLKIIYNWKFKLTNDTEK